MKTKDFVSVKEVASQWGVTVRRVQMLCLQGQILGAIKNGHTWLVPVGARRPRDRRINGDSKRYSVNGKGNKSLSLDYVMSMRFLSTMAFEMRNELNTIMGYSDMLTVRTDEPDIICEYAASIKESSRNILRQIENTILLSKIYSEEVSIEECVCSLSEIVQEVVDSFSEDAAYKSINIIVRNNLSHELVYADQEKIKIVLGNLIDNALKHSQISAEVIISVEEIKSFNNLSTVRFTIEDFGKGMSQIFLKHLFNTFTLTSAKKEKEIQSLGIGLAIVKGMSELLGGTLNIKSKVNQGTQASVLMEFRCADLTIAKSEENFDIDICKITGHRVLIADDNQMNREIAMEIFSDAGIYVECAEDGIICTAMVEKADDYYYDCIFMDLQMPNLNGIAATRIIRSLPNQAKANIPIIAMTANVQLEDRQGAIRAGMNGFLEKPFDIRKMYSIFQKVLKETKFEL